MRRRNTETLKEVIEQYLRAVGADKRLKEIRLSKQWEEIMGRSIAMRTEKIEIRNGIFHIKINSSVVKHELSMIKQELIKKLNDTAGEKLVNDIKFY